MADNEDPNKELKGENENAQDIRNIIASKDNVIEQPPQLEPPIESLHENHKNQHDHTKSKPQHHRRMSKKILRKILVCIYY